MTLTLPRARAAVALLLLGACAAPRPGGLEPPRSDAAWIEVPDGHLYYEVAGSGPALVLLHGGFGDRRMWDRQFRAYARDFRVVRYDHRGFGRSPAPRGPYSPADDLVRLMDHLGIERAHLVGNSMGGALAIDFALLHPARVDRLVVVASGANGVPLSDEDVRSVVEVFAAARTEGPGGATRRWLAHPMVAVAVRTPGVAGLLRTMVEDNHAVFGMSHWPSEPLRPAAYERLPELRAPTLFILGEQDTPLVQRVVRASVERLPGARLVVLRGTDHLPHLEAPEEFDRQVLAFLLP